MLYRVDLITHDGDMGSFTVYSPSLEAIRKAVGPNPSIMSETALNARATYSLPLDEYWLSLRVIPYRRQMGEFG